MRVHGILLYYVLLAVFLGALVAINYVNMRKRRLASEHDHAVVADLLRDMPPDSLTVAWLKRDGVVNGIPSECLDVIGTVYEKIELNVIGLDNRAANKAYRDLAAAMIEFRTLVAYNTFPNDGMTWFRLSDRWSAKHRKEAEQKIDKAQGVLVAAYDRFLVISHEHRLDQPAASS